VVTRKRRLCRRVTTQSGVSGTGGCLPNRAKRPHSECCAGKPASRSCCETANAACRGKQRRGTGRPHFRGAPKASNRGRERGALPPPSFNTPRYQSDRGVFLFVRKVPCSHVRKNFLEISSNVGAPGSSTAFHDVLANVTTDSAGPNRNPPPAGTDVFSGSPQPFPLARQPHRAREPRSGIASPSFRSLATSR
jgi:hypothetical protein